MNCPLVTVVMPIWDEAGFIADSLRAVVDQEYPKEHLEVLVVDGMSTDGTRQIVRSFQDEHQFVRLIDNPQQIVPVGLNLAVAQARGEIFVRVDGHCVIAPDYIRRCVDHLQKDNVDAIGGPLTTIGHDWFSQAIAEAMSSPFGVGDSSFRTKRNATMLTDTVAFPAYRRAVIDRLGPFDEELVRNQDDEYNYRLRKMGGKILLAADIRARYYSRSSLKSLWRQYFQYGFWKVRVMQKHPWQMRVRQFVPFAFVATLIISAAVAPFVSNAVWVLGLLCGSYLCATLAASVLKASQGAWAVLPLLPLAFATLHFAYGFGFLVGLLKFRGRWGDAKQSLPSHATQVANI